MSLQTMTLLAPAGVAMLTVVALLGTVSHHCRQKARWAAELAAVNRKARTDTLTGLPNRDGLISEMTARINREDTWSLILLDLDGFKPVNDRLGHHVGDMVLVTVARRLRASVDDRSFVARLGGDEFVVILPGPAERAPHLIDHITQLINQPQMYHDVVLRVGISAGVAGYEPGLGWYDMIHRADAAMYRAKERRCGQARHRTATTYEAATSISEAAPSEFTQTERQAATVPFR